MPIVACVGCTRPLKFDDVPSDSPIICDSCQDLIARRYPPPAGTVPPDLPTPASLRTLRIPEPPELVPAEPTVPAKPDLGFNTNKLIVTLVVLLAAVSLALLALK